jgi:type IV secretion system protein VirB8
MKLTKSKSTSDIISKSIDFEVTLLQGIKNSERRAWIVAACSCLLSIFLAVGYFFLLPLKEKVPYLVMADPYTGTSNLSKMTENFQSQNITRNEAINKSNVARYIIARESYDWELTGRGDWIIVNSMSAPIILKPFLELYDEKNPLNPDKILGQGKTIRIKVKTIVLTNAGSDGNTTGSTVRFDKILLDKQSERIEKVESFIATMAYEYRPNLNMQEDYRVQNPLGFKVTGYRLDPELAAGSKDLTLKEISNSAILK